MYHAGGHGSPLVFFLDRFGKKYGANKLIGEEFMSAVADLAKPSIDEPLTYIRIAALATNLTSTKQSMG